MIKRKRKYQWAGDLVGTNMLPAFTVAGKRTNNNDPTKSNYIPSPTIANDNYVSKQPNLNYNYTVKQDNIQQPNYQPPLASNTYNPGTITKSPPKTLYNTYFNTPKNEHGTGLIRTAANIINAYGAAELGQAGIQGVKYGAKKLARYADRKMLNYGREAFTPNLNSAGNNLLGNTANEATNIKNLQNIDLQRNVAPKIKVAKPSFDDVDLNNGLILRNNPSRVADQGKLLGKNRELKSVLDNNTGEYIKLYSWTDKDGKLFYKMSANMPSSPIKAGKAYLELEKHIPIGATLMDDTSLSYDSFLNTIKQTKKSKFKPTVYGELPMNNSSKTMQGLQNEYTQRNLAFASKEEAEQQLLKVNELLQKHNLPNAKINYQTNYTDDGKELKYFGINIPQIGLEKLYQLGIPLTALGISQQGKTNQQVRKHGGKINKLTMNNKYEYGGVIGDESFLGRTSNVGSFKGIDSGQKKKKKLSVSTLQPKWALANGAIPSYHNSGLQVRSKMGGKVLKKRIYKSGGLVLGTGSSDIASMLKAQQSKLGYNPGGYSVQNVFNKNVNNNIANGETPWVFGSNINNENGFKVERKPTQLITEMPNLKSLSNTIKDYNNTMSSFKDQIASNESKGMGGYNAINQDSGAAGKYQFMPSHHKKDVERMFNIDWKTFIKTPELQERYMDYWTNKTLRPTAQELLKKYPNAGFNENQLMAMVHFQGAGGAEQQLRNGTLDKTVGYNKMTTRQYVSKIK